MNCIFCKIINKEIPSSVVYEDAQVIAFLDIFPTNPGHTLVVPKMHTENILSISVEDLSYLTCVVQKVAAALQKGLKLEGFNVIQNNGTVAGQAVPHLHFHIVPRVTGDGFEHWRGVPYSSSAQAEDIANKIRSCF